ncbi:MAG: radical SAM protein [Candidatus Nealsonbacteria bacterium]|nr:radical SAM protein [Candidatus Nealsonbacteria bacterium]
MHVVLWDTRKLNASKDFAGGFGVGVYPGLGGIRGKLIRRFFTRDHRPVALLYAHLTSVFRQLGHQVRYVVDRIPSDADVVVFCPSLITLHLERQAMARVAARNPSARVLVVGLVPTVMPEAFDGLDVTVVKGEAEQLLWRLDEVLQRPAATVQLGTLADLDSLPMPDWSPFRPQRFRIGYDFWRFPTALVQASRGCTFGCDYCPYTIVDRTARFRDPEAVVEEIRHGVRQWGFRSFKFRDPLFGLNRRQAFRLAELIARMPQKIQFSIETRIDLMPPELLRVLRRVGLTSITVGIETPDERKLRQYGRHPVADDRQQEFVTECRRMGIRTVAGFMIGFPDDTVSSIIRTSRYAKQLNPTFANFNLVTPYPGTEFFKRMVGRIAHFDYSRYTVYTPVLQYEHLSAGQLSRLHAKCFRNFYFRWRYVRENAPLLWPRLQALGIGGKEPAEASAEAPHPGVPRPLSGLDVLHRKGLRADGPHRRGAGQRTSEHRTEE